MTDLFLGDVFGVLSWPFLKYYSAVWCSAADTHSKLLDRVVSGARFLTGSVFECDIAHRRSVSVLWIGTGVTWCTLFMVLNLCRMCHRGYHAVLWSHIGMLMSLSLQNLTVQQDLYSPLSVNVERAFYPCIRWCWTGEFQEQAQCCFYWPKLLDPILFSTVFPLNSFCLYVGLAGRGVWTDRVWITL